MNVVTLLTAFAVSVLVLMLSPIYGLVSYIAVVIWYPYSLTVKIGTIDFSASRIILIVLWVNILMRKGVNRQYNFTMLDKAIIVYFVAQIISGVTTTDMMKMIENRAGAFFDVALPYFAIRLIVNDKKKYIIFLKGLAIACALLLIPAAFESFTGHNLLDFGRGFQIDQRWGLYRAFASFRHPIARGIFLAMAGASCAGLTKSVARSQKWIYILSITMIGLGILFTLSSGPFICAILSIIFIAHFPIRKYWKTTIVVLVIMCLMVEIISNRHFYDVIDRFAFNSRTAWYRNRLIEVALFEGGMSGHWLMGYGFAEPGWCYLIDGRNHTDIVNHYLLILCRYGLVGFLPFCAIIYFTIATWCTNIRLSQSIANTWLLWCNGGAIFGALIAFNSVAYIGQPITLFYMTLALCGAYQMIFRQPDYQLCTNVHNNRRFYS